MPEAQIYTTNRNYALVRKASSQNEIRDWFTEYNTLFQEIDDDVELVDGKAIAAGVAASNAASDAADAASDAATALSTANQAQTDASAASVLAGNLDVAVTAQAVVTAARIEATQEPTGILQPDDPDDLQVLYDPTTRVVTINALNGFTLFALYQNAPVPGMTGTETTWVSNPIAAPPTDSMYLSYEPAYGVNWSASAGIAPFRKVQIARACYKSGVFCFAQKETHGFMPWQVHRAEHRDKGTVRVSGGDVSSLVAGSTTPADRRPSFAACVLADEDNIVKLPLMNSGTDYTLVSLSGAESAALTKGSAEVIKLVAGVPYYNQFTGGVWVDTAIPTSPSTSYFSVYAMANTVTSDAESQRSRIVFWAPQSHGTLSAQRALLLSSLVKGDFATFVPEFNFLEKLIFVHTATGWSFVESQRLVGSRENQMTLLSSQGLTSVSSDATIAGDGTPLDPLSVEASTQTVYENSIAASEDGITLTSLGEKSTVRIDHTTFGSSTPAEEVGLSGFNAIKVSTKPAGGTPVSISVCNKYMGWVDDVGKFWLRDSIDMAEILDVASLTSNHMALSDYFAAHITATNVEYRSLPELELEQVARTNGTVYDCHIALSGRVYFVDGSDVLVIMSPERLVEYSVALTGVAGTVINISVNKAETRLYIVDDIGTGIYIRQYELTGKTLVASSPLMEGGVGTVLSQYPDEADTSLIYYNRTSDAGVDFMESLTSIDVTLGAVYSENMDNIVGPSAFHNGILYSVDTSMRKYMTPGAYRKLPYNLRLASATSVAVSNTEDSSEIYTLYDLTNEVKRRRSDRFGDEIKVVRKASQLLAAGEVSQTIFLDVEDIFNADSQELISVDFVARGSMRGATSTYYLRRAYSMARDGYIEGSELPTIDTITGYDEITSVTPRLYTNVATPTHATKMEIRCTLLAESAMIVDARVDWVFEIRGYAIKGAGAYC